MNSARCEWYSLVIITVGMAIVALRAPLNGLHGLQGRLWQATLVGGPAMCLAASTWRPGAWHRHRAWAVPAIRVGTHLVPMQRSAQTGGAALLLGRPAQEGLPGVALDAFRLMVGTRLLGNVLATLMVPLPLPVAAATNAATVLLTRNNQQLCQTELLASPLSRQRLAHLHTLLDACCFMVLPFTPASLLSDQPGSTAQACSATLNFLQVLCILVPVALLVWTQPPAEQSGSAEQSEQRQQELHQQLENTGQVPELCGWPAGLAAVLRRASSGADSLLRWTFLVQGSWVQRAVHLMVLFDGVWLAMKVSS
ncbi:hypothetical protein ABPG77_004476 [Micractinium sp. CCAP 211/92]